MSTNLDYLIGDIYNTILSDAPWDDLLGRLRLALDLRWCSLIFRTGDPGSNFVAHTNADKSLDVEGGNKAVRGKYAHEWSILDHHSLSAGEIYNPRTDPAYMQSGYYTELATIAGDVHELIIRISDTDSANVWLTIGRQPEHGAFTPEHITELERLTPHLVRAMKFFDRERFYQSLISVTDSTLSDIGKGIVVLNSEGDILHTNETAKNLLSMHQAFIVDEKRLSFSDPEINASYIKSRNTISASREREIETNEIVEHLTNLCCDCGVDVSILVRAAPILDEYWGSNTPSILIYMVERKPPNRISIKSLVTLFGLTKTEAKLVQKIAEGETLAEASKNLNMGLGTARNHLKRIFRKVGVSRQSDLIIAVNESVLPLSQKDVIA